MPSSAAIWQLRSPGRPSIVTRHSKQIPIPQSAARGSPLTDVRNRVAPLKTTAAATLVPTGTLTDSPSTDSSTCSGMYDETPSRFVWRRRDNGRSAQDQISQQTRGSQRSRNAQAFMSDRKINTAKSGTHPNQRKLVGSCCAESSPGANGGKILQPRHVLDRPGQHVAQHVSFCGRVFHAELPGGAN